MTVATASAIRCPVQPPGGLIHRLKPKRAARWPQVGQQIVLGQFHAVRVFCHLFHAASTRFARLRGQLGLFASVR